MMKNRQSLVQLEENLGRKWTDMTLTLSRNLGDGLGNWLVFTKISLHDYIRISFN